MLKIKRYVKEFANDRIADIRSYRNRLQRDIDTMTDETRDLFDVDNLKQIIAKCDECIETIQHTVQMCEYGYISEYGAVKEIPDIY